MKMAKDISLDSFDIAFDHVSFAYENGNPILNDVSFFHSAGKHDCD